jgi:hypothetical protein
MLSFAGAWRNRSVSVRLICVAQLVVSIGLVLSAFGVAQDGSPATPPKFQEPLYFPPSCTTDQPVYTNRGGKPIVLNTDSLLKRATHCEAPAMPTLASQLRIAGYVSVDILVNDTGKVLCVQRFNVSLGTRQTRELSRGKRKRSPLGALLLSGGKYSETF